MKETKYFCNLCREQKKSEELMCMAWDNAKYVITSNIHNSDKHICKECIRIIKS